MKNLLLFSLILLLVGCGYKPASKITKEVLGDRVYLKVVISVQDPQNSVLIRDSITDALITRLGKTIVPENMAQTKIEVSLGSVGFTPITFNRSGDVSAYKAVVTLNLKTTFMDGTTKNISTTGNYDFAIGEDSIISDSQRYEAIRSASFDALDEYVAAVSVMGLGMKIAEPVVVEEEKVEENFLRR